MMMQKKATALIGLTIVMLLMGCASNRSGSTESTNSADPDWWFNPATSETHYYGFAQAKKQNPNLAQKVATARARDEISNQVKAFTRSELRDWTQESGLGETAEALAFTDNTMQTTSNNALEGATPDKYVKSKDGTVFVRVSYLKNRVNKALVEAAKRDEALFNEFKASQSFKRMDEKVAANK
jgi:hypothetical protein